MKVTTPEIAWHEAFPVLSCDLQPFSSEESSFDTFTRLATCGGEPIVRLWRVIVSFSPSNSSIKDTELLEPLASLRMHKKPVNVVRWSKSGILLASGSDDSTICLWKKSDDDSDEVDENAKQLAQTLFNSKTSGAVVAEDQDIKDKETWTAIKVLKSHLEDVYDLCWSTVDDCHLISGSVDHAAIVWRLPSNLTKPNSAKSNSGGNSGSLHNLILHDHKHYVQGVAWDPRDVFVCSLSSDRSLRVYRIGSRNCLHHVVRARMPSCQKGVTLGGKLFQDDSWKSFFRRLEFSPDGEFLLCPAGVINQTDLPNASLPGIVGSGTADSGSSLANYQHAAHLFHRSQLSRPCLSFPTQRRPVIAVRFCPQPFLRLSVDETNADDPPYVFSRLGDDNGNSRPLLPYRWVFCLALENSSLLFYDTDHIMPIAQISGLHYQCLNDVSWSSDGRCLVTCSTDGYCTIIHFSEGELGIPYPREKIIHSRSKTSSKSSSAKSGSKKVKCEEMDVSMPDLQLVETPLQIKPKPKQENKSPSTLKDKRRVLLVPVAEVKVETPFTQEEENMEKENIVEVQEPIAPSAKRRRVSLVTLSDIPKMVVPDLPESDVPVPQSEKEVNDCLETPKRRRVSFQTLEPDIFYFNPKCATRRISSEKPS